MKQLVLIGFMGAGKSTVGKLLAQALDVTFVDSDDVIIDKAEMSVADYFAKHGEEAFRQLESDTLRELSSKPGVIATGGGIVTNQGNREMLKEIPNVVFLKTDPTVFLERIKGDEEAVRPLVQEKSSQEIVRLFKSRVAFYEACADWVVDTSQLTPEEVCEAVLVQVSRKNS